MAESIMVFTRNSVDDIFASGGTGWWTLDRRRAKKCEFVICTHNSEGASPTRKGAIAPVGHGDAFLLGRDLVVSQPDSDGRVMIQMAEYAELQGLKAWRGNQNPVSYLAHVTSEFLGVDLESLSWKPFPRDRIAAAPLTVAQAKAGLAVGLGVPVESIEIVIRA